MKPSAGALTERRDLPSGGWGGGGGRERERERGGGGRKRKRGRRGPDGYASKQQRIRAALVTRGATRFTMDNKGTAADANKSPPPPPPTPPPTSPSPRHPPSILRTGSGGGSRRSEDVLLLMDAEAVAAVSYRFTKVPVSE